MPDGSSARDPGIGAKEWSDTAASSLSNDIGHLYASLATRFAAAPPLESNAQFAAMTAQWQPQVQVQPTTPTPAAVVARRSTKEGDLASILREQQSTFRRRGQARAAAPKLYADSQHELRHGSIKRRLADMAQTQDHNRIRIDTILNKTDPAPDGEDDPLLLAEVQGTEGISQPFCYEVTLLRNTKYTDINIADMRDTVARIGIKVKTPGGDRWFCRTGVIDHFEELSITTKFRVRHYHTYRARIIPPIDMMMRQTFFRIFENTNAPKILETVLDSIPHMNGNPKSYNLQNLDCIEWPYLNHRIQFGEDTYSFLIRLMAEFGIWYYYDFEFLEQAQVDSTKQSLSCSPIVLFGPAKLAGQDAFKPADQFPFPVAVNGAPGENEIGGIIRSYDPAINYFEVGNFNPLKPSQPRSGKAGKRGAADKSASSRFPATLDRQKDADPAAEHLLDQSLDSITMISGSSINPTFACGRTFRISSDVDDPDEQGREFVIASLALHAYDNSIGGQVGAGVVSFLNGWIWEPIKGIGLDIINPICQLVGGKPVADAGPAGNVSLALAAGGLNNMWKNQIQLDAQTTQYQHSKANNIQPLQPGYASAPTNLGALTYFEAGAISAITGIISTASATFGKPLSEVWQMADLFGKGSNYGNSFTALPKFVANPPTPKAPRISVSGPHLAVVIGRDGALKQNGDDITGIYADSFGRVRIRFPWDPGPPRDQRKASPPGETVTPPLTSGENTCWVRVSQPWASRAYGAQFLPRIGDEVIVDFLDGDPDRPIITGRIYNADHGYANQPFPNDQQSPNAIPIAADYLLNPSPPTSGKFTRSGIKTCTVRNGEAVPAEFHLLRFDDDSDYEQVVLRSQGRMDVTAFHSRFETTYGDRHVLVKQGTDDKGQTFGGSAFTTVGGEYDLHVGGNRYEVVDKDCQLIVKGDTSLHLEGDLKAVVGGTASIGANLIVLEATEQITLKVGSSWIVLSPCGLYINGPMVYINSGGAPQSASTVTMVDVADAKPADPGYPDDWMKQQGNSGGGGQRGSHTYGIQPGPLCALEPDGKMGVDPLAGGMPSAVAPAAAAPSGSPDAGNGGAAR